MTPTPAQIEAVAKIYRAVLAERDHEAYAALQEYVTAAAEVAADRTAYVEALNYAHNQEKAAAAEVGPLRELKSFGHAGPDGSNEDETAIRHATIERCAQVAEGIGDMFTSAKIATAIRALKDKP